MHVITDRAKVLGGYIIDCIKIRLNGRNSTRKRDGLAMPVLRRRRGADSRDYGLRRGVFLVYGLMEKRVKVLG